MGFDVGFDRGIVVGLKVGLSVGFLVIDGRLEGVFVGLADGRFVFVGATDG